MDIKRAPNAKKLDLCKKYFQIGFFCLPFVWAVNVVWFYSEMFSKPEYTEQNSIKKYVLLSAIGALIWTIAIITWLSIYVQNRAAWGELGDYISFTIPMGSP